MNWLSHKDVTIEKLLDELKSLITASAEADMTAKFAGITSENRYKPFEEQVEAEIIRRFKQLEQEIDKAKVAQLPSAVPRHIKELIREHGHMD